MLRLLTVTQLHPNSQVWAEKPEVQRGAEATAPGIVREKDLLNCKFLSRRATIQTRHKEKHLMQTKKRLPLSSNTIELFQTIFKI